MSMSKFGSLLALLGLCLLAGESSPANAISPAWRLPISAPATLMAQFRSPNSDYSSGHRGVDYLVSEGQAVLAPSGGTVAFTGQVAGKSVVTLQHRDGLKTAFEPVCGSLPLGSSVVVGQIIGSVCATGYTSHCAPAICLHFSLRSNGNYLSPLVLIGGLAPSVLVPIGH